MIVPNILSDFQVKFLKYFELDPMKYERAGGVAFEDLPEIMRAYSRKVPFENLNIIDKTYEEITKKHLTEKIIDRREGGLCYQQNTFFYMFLEECKNLDCWLVRANVKINSSYTAFNGHVIIILQNNGTKYIVDNGFGQFLALQPVPITESTDGDSATIVESKAGKFRAYKKDAGILGDYWLERIQPLDSTTAAYSFSLKKVGLPEVNETQQIIINDPEGEFNKVPLYTILQEDGYVTLTKDSFTHTDKNWKKTKETFDSSKFNQVLFEKFKLVKNIKC
ncbi:arylamine N-acetyltransferase family protein [Tieghemostelium lacteum]|uniref:Arylamine N-acetyltransferase family protein n=1 Tax=Tieghemostelium lacteum TaxID=361077 RepID=A0A151Z7P7_TIELA|nr:arylamine N-acetyltransferase family protein [Tieghemostelium lacteum]|eukprot:KYQ89981.1 arylamine N-acetyltransferase family protein [Tieghemostelium lacteum]